MGRFKQTNTLISNYNKCVVGLDRDGVINTDLGTYVTRKEDFVPIEKRVEYARMFLAIISIISDSEYLIVNSGNVGIWTCLFRGSCKNTYQYLNHKKKTDFIGWKYNN